MSVLLQSGFPFMLYLCDVNSRETSKTSKSRQIMHEVKKKKVCIYSSPKEKSMCNLEGWSEAVAILCSLGRSRAGYCRSSPKSPTRYLTLLGGMAVRPAAAPASQASSAWFQFCLLVTHIITAAGDSQRQLSFSSVTGLPHFISLLPSWELVLLTAS